MKLKSQNYNIKKLVGKLITATRNKTDETRSNTMEKNRKQKWKEKQLNECFKQLTSDVSREKTWLRKENLKPETESLLISAQNNSLRTNHIKARKDKTQQNSRCRL